MKLFNKDLDRDVAVIAEIGVNHEGCLDTALKLIRLAASAGADAVKFQSYTPERFISANDVQRLVRVKKFCLSLEAHEQLAEEADKAGIIFFSTPVTEDWISLLTKFSNVGKIASGDLTFEPMIREAARSYEKLIISTGASTIEEIDRSVRWVSEEIGSDCVSERLILMHCVSQYPTLLKNANVRSVNYLIERFNLTIGYSNHVIGPEACMAAVALGARVIEVHFTDQKNNREFHDHALSFEAKDLEELITTVNNINISLGKNTKILQPGEEAIRAALRKGLVAAKPLKKGETLTVENVMFARPATEFTSEDYSKVIGTSINRDLKPGETINRDDVELGEK
jgi:N,N'-diacetyllegionaminate synthase